MIAPGTAVPLSAHVPETLRLENAFERAVRDLPEGPWLAPNLAERAEAVRGGEPVDGYLFVGPADEAVGIAFTSPDTEAGLTAHPFLSEGFQTAAALGAFLSALEVHRPVRVVYEPIVGIPEAERARLLQARGYRRITRVDMGLAEDVPLPVVPDDPEFPTRPLTAEDGPALAALLARSYDDNVEDRTLFQRWLDPEEDARRSVPELLGAGLGTWRSDASFGVPVPGGLAAATLVHAFHGPLISEVMTDPRWRRRGFARRLLVRSVRAIRAAGLGAPRLVVTVENGRAHALYTSLGFVERPEAKGDVWIRPIARSGGPTPPDRRTA